MAREKGCKPEESKTVRQWAKLGRIPIEGIEPCYVWDLQEYPHTVYYREEDTRKMTAMEQKEFLEDPKAYCERYVQMIAERWKEEGRIWGKEKRRMKNS